MLLSLVPRLSPVRSLEVRLPFYMVNTYHANTECTLWIWKAHILYTVFNTFFIWVIVLFAYLYSWILCRCCTIPCVHFLSYFIFTECTAAAHVYRDDNCDGTKWLPSQSTGSTETHNSQLMYAMRRWILMMMSCIYYVFLSMHKLSINIQSEKVVGCICVFILRPVTYLFVLYTSTGWWRRSSRCSQHTQCDTSSAVFDCHLFHIWQTYIFTFNSVDSRVSLCANVKVDIAMNWDYTCSAKWKLRTGVI